MKKVFTKTLILFVIFIGLNNTSSKAQVPQAERDALIALYNATDGANWTDNTNWNTAAAVTDWFGVVVVNNRVTELYLDNNNLIGNMPAELGNLSELINLFLWQNQLSGTIPGTLGNLSNLLTLSLSYNELTGGIPIELGNLSSLENLYLRDNQLTGEIPIEIGDLSNIIEITFWNNELSGTIPAELSNLTTMLRLFLGNNQLTGNIPIELGSLTNLEILYLNNNLLTGSIPVELGNLSQLQELILHTNQLSGSIPVALANLTNLTELNFAANQLTGGIPPELGDLTNLNYLDFSPNNLGGTIPQELGNLVNLQTLWLNDNGFTGVVPTSFQNLINLENLYFQQNELDDLPNLTNLTNLATFWVYGNNFTFDDIESNIGITGITYSPQNQILGPGSISINSGEELNISIPVGGTTNQYQWVKDGGDIGGAQTDNLIIGSISAADAGTYYLRITNTVVGGLTLRTDDIIVTVPPANDLCLDAVTIACGDLIASTTVDATVDIGVAPNCGSATTTGPGVWYHYVGTGETVNLSTCNAANFDTSISVFTGTCADGLDCVAGNDDGTGCSNFTSDLDFNSELGVDYYILVHTWNSGSGDFTLSISCTATIPPPPNNNCVDAELLTVFSHGTGTPTDGTNENATNYTGQLACDQFSNITDVWYTFNSGANSIVQMNRTLLTAGTLGYALYDDCVSTAIICSNGFDSEVFLSVTPDTDYWIQVWNDNEEGTFDILLSDPPPFGGVSESDYNSLLALYNATDGANWNNNNNWNTATPVSAWYGVVVNGGRVTEIALDNNNLEGSIPMELGDLSELVNLFLWENQLSGTIPTTIGNLSNLLTLSLSYNQLTGNIPSELGNLSLLENLFLRDNQLSGEIPVAIGNLSNIIEITFWNNELSGAIPAELGNLTNMLRLFLGNNQLTGTIPIELGSLTNLEILYLNNNLLTGSIPTQLGNLSQLKELFIHTNQLSGSIPAELANLSSLTVLQLGSNQLTGGIPPELGDLSSLEVFDLSSNPLGGSVPSQLGNLTNLTELYLSSTQLSGSIPPELGLLSNLVKLWLNNNLLSGSLPTELGNLINVDDMLVGDNNLSGSIPISFGGLVNMSRFNLRNNQLTGDVPIELGNMGSANGLGLVTYVNLERNLLTNLPDITGFGVLASFDVWDNNLHFDDLETNTGLSYTLNYSPQNVIPGPGSINLSETEELNILIPVGGTANQYQWVKNGVDIAGAITDNLVIASVVGTDEGTYSLRITNTLVSGLTLVSEDIIVTVAEGSLTSDRDALIALYNATDGANWDFPYNTNWNTAAPIGDWFGITVTNGRVSVISLANGNLIGAIPSEIGDLEALTSLSLALNSISGSLPVEIGNLTLLNTLQLFGNQISGNLPNELGSLTNLTSLSLADNQFTGAIPVVLGNLTSLEFLGLRGNNLSGAIPPELGNITNLQNLRLESCQFTGSIPVELGNLSNLEWLYLSNNQLTGSIPAELGNLSNLTILELSNNLLDGSIPVELGDLTLLEQLVLHTNQLSGSIPPELGNLGQIVEIELQNNQLSGTITGSFLPNLEVLDFSNNNLTGELPTADFLIPAIITLNLSGNDLMGAVPTELNTLPFVATLNLSDNNFSSLPDLTPLTTLTSLDVSTNNLTFESIEGNIGITGFLYSPQYNISGSAPIEVVEGAELNISISVGGTANQYQWVKDGLDIGGATTDNLVVGSTVVSDAGTYYLEITNTLASGLTLRSDDIVVTVLTCTPTMWYADADGDGFGDLIDSQSACDQPTGYVANSDDCDDTNGSITIEQTWYADDDGDGFGNLNSTSISCTQPIGYVLDNTDCDDTNGALHIGTTWYADTDGDGFGDASNFQLACTQPTGFVANNTDCNDNNISINANLVWYADVDGDGFGDANNTTTSCTQPTGFVPNNDDCDDSNAAINPTLVWYADTDSDGFGDANTTQTSCIQPTGYVANNTDCDDTNASANVNVNWYADADGDGFGDANNMQSECTQPVGYVANNTDCNDTDVAINPTATDLAGSGIDANCDGNYAWFVDVDGDTYGSTSTVSSTNSTPGAGESGTSDDCNDADSEVNPGVIWFSDADGDGFGNAANTTTGCTQPTGFVADNTDCDDTDAAINPDVIWYADTDGDGHGDAANTTTGCTQPAGFVASSDDCDDTDADVYPTAPALADGKDNNCDGTIDKVSQTITFEALADVEDGNGDITLVASSTSQLAVSFAVSGPATVDGVTLTITGAGSVTVTASQAGDDGYLASEDVSQSFCVNPVPEATITFNGAAAVTLSSNYSEGNQWFLNEVSISGATSQEYDPDQGGLFHVEVSIDGCQGVSNTIDLILTEIENNTFDNSLNIYPMPVSSILTIDTKNLPSGEYVIRMVDMTGKYKMDKRIRIVENSRKEINVNELPQGTYTLILQHGEDVFIQKVIKK